MSVRWGLWVTIVALMPPTTPSVAQMASPETGHAPLCAPVVMDGDGDGLDDSCEWRLARRFAPVFVASPAACNWSADQGRLEGGYLFGVETTPSGAAVRIAYFPAYFDDCGWSGPKCWVRLGGGCRPHVGDSEAVVVEVTADRVGSRAAARVTAVFLSAHCFGSSAGGCRWFSPKELEWEGERPVLWVAEGKNANYPSKSACDRGHLFFDTCDRNAARFSFPLISEVQNVGAADAPFPYLEGGDGCVAADEIPTIPEDRSGVECFWSDSPFGGWSSGLASGGSEEEGSTPYFRYLMEVAEFGNR